ncbi:trypsin I-P1-like isoform X2 [Lissotriton helveticus]
MKLFLLLALAAWQHAAAFPTKVEDINDIVNGYNCPQKSKPWQVFLTYQTEEGSSFCGGSLINQNWILSAAHCMGLPGTMVARLGEQVLSEFDFTEQDIAAVKQIQHPNYNPETLDNDIMLIKLAQPAQYNQYAQPIPLPTSCVAAGTWCTVSGWGDTIPDVQNADNLQCLNVPIIASGQCQQAYPAVYTDNMMCAGFMRGGQSTCYGDSGGPLVCNGQLQGVVSFAKWCALKGYPSVFTKVCNYNDWISQTMSSN